MTPLLLLKYNKVRSFSKTIQPYEMLFDKSLFTW